MDRFNYSLIKLFSENRRLVGDLNKAAPNIWLFLNAGLNSNVLVARSTNANSEQMYNFFKVNRLENQGTKMCFMK